MFHTSHCKIWSNANRTPSLSLMTMLEIYVLYNDQRRTFKSVYVHAYRLGVQQLTYLNVPHWSLYFPRRPLSKLSQVITLTKMFPDTKFTNLKMYPYMDLDIRLEYCQRTYLKDHTNSLIKHRKPIRFESFLKLSTHHCKTTRKQEISNKFDH